MIQVFKIINNIDRVNVHHFFQTVNDRATRGHPYKIYKHHAKKDCRRKFFSQRIINTWNSLPTSVVTADTTNTFKNRLDAHWKDIMYISTPHAYNQITIVNQNLQVSVWIGTNRLRPSSPNTTTTTLSRA